MTVTDVRKDSAACTMTVTTEFDASAEQVWQMWANPRLLERWWGPPMYPATVVDHELAPGGKVTYYMTSPEGEQYHGYWNVVAVDAPNSLELLDGFADGDGNVNPEMPSTATRVSITAADGRTLMVIESQFASPEAMAQLLEMGMEEGLKLALGQIDGLLAE
jgi:uncharacterized protein YndB with AHSA1/START domain